MINSPQAAILAVGAITETPVVRDGEITVAQLMGVTLACDHRILYGAEGAEFLARVRSLLTGPLGLALSAMPEELIDVPIESLPHIDEHSVSVAAPADVVWRSLLDVVSA